MSLAKTKAAIIDALNRCMPAARDAKLGTKLDQVIAAANAVQTDYAALRTAYNALQADLAAHRTAYAALVTKLNADAGVTDVDYAAPAALTSAQAGAATSGQVTDIGLA